MSADQLDPDEEIRRRFDERELLREAEDAAEQLDRNTRTLADVIEAAVVDGNRVELEVGSVMVSGFPFAVNATVVRVRDGAATRLVNMAAVGSASVIPSDEPSATSDPPDGDLSLIGLLRGWMTADDAEPVRLVTTLGKQWEGRLVGVAEDHLELEADNGSLHACRIPNVAYLER